MKNILPIYLHKNEDAETYKKFAEKGMDLMFPVRMNGVSDRPDIGILYHVTIKLFDAEKDTVKEVHEIAQNLSLVPPDPKNIEVETTTIEGRTGYTIHVLKLHGPEIKDIEESHNQFKHLGYHNNYQFAAHISVDKETWDRVKESESKNAKDLGIEFLPAELHHKAKIVASYRPKHARLAGQFEAEEKDKLAASETMVPSIIRETILVELDLKKHEKATRLGDAEVLRYLQDNPGLKEEVMTKHEKRAAFHFGSDAQLLKWAMENGIKNAYMMKNGK